MADVTTGSGADWVSRLAPIPDPDSPPGRLAQELRKLARTAPVKSLQEFATLINYVKSTISAALSGKPHSVASKEVIEKVCEACHADESTKKRLLHLRTLAVAGRGTPRTDDTDPGEVRGAPPRRRRFGGPVIGWMIGLVARWTFSKVAVVLVILAALTVGTTIIVSRSWWCGQGVRRIGDQCIGVTEGQVVLRADLFDVLGKIREENKWVDDQSGKDAVSVAYLVALPAPSADDDLAVLLRHELQGVYIAQWKANHTKILGDRPLIRLLVTNDGDGSNHWPTVLPELLDRVGGSERLVAAVVTGRTLTPTVDAIDHLRQGGVAVIASRLTGDIITNLDQNQLAALRGGLARVAPTNSNQTIAAAKYLKQDAGRAVLVKDVKSGDPYVQSLAVAFRQGFEDPTHHLLEPVETYDSGIGGAANTMAAMLRNICQERPDVVFFAGRTPELGAFVQALPGRPCRDTPIKIVAGADSVEFAAKVATSPELRDGLNANASLIYTTQAHPGAWTAAAGSFNPEPWQHFGWCDHCYKNVFPDEPLDDGAAIIGYDAITIAVTAIRPGQDGPAGQGINDRPELISQQFNRLHGTEAVGGASGWISLTDGRQGSTVNKAVAIEQVTSDGVIHFLGLSSADGSPCVPNKTRC